MPLYEYTCNACGQRFETLVRSFREAVRCPGCDSSAVEKQLSTFAFAGGGTTSSSGGGGCGCGRGGCGCHH